VLYFIWEWKKEKFEFFVEAEKKEFTLTEHLSYIFVLGMFLYITHEIGFYHSQFKNKDGLRQGNQIQEIK
jgi:hypothetical protein